MTIELRTIPVISTGHMPHSNAWEDFKEAVYSTGHGHIVMVSWDTDDWPEWFYQIGKWARANGYDWIWFDCDAPAVDGLPVFDW